MGIKRIIQNRLLVSAKPFAHKRRWRPGETPLQLVGLIYYLEDISELGLVKRVQKLFSAQGAVCHTCIYQKDKKMILPEELIDEDMVLLNRDSLNWYGQVRTGCAEFFLHESFDIIVDLSKDFFFPITYLVSMSKATLKIGRFVHPQGPFRLVLGANNPEDEDAFIELLNSSLQFLQFG